MASIDSLAASELFARVADPDCRALEAQAQARRAKPGEAIFRLGDPAESLYVVRSGTVELTAPLLVLGEARDIRFQTLEAGATLGWSAVIPPRLFTMSARATTDVDLWGFAPKVIEQAFAERPECGLKILENLVRTIASRLHVAQALWMRELQRHVAQSYK